MLDAVAELADDLVRHVVGILGHEEHADALGADQAYHLGDALKQGLGCAGEQQVCLVEEEHQARQVGVAALGQLLHQLRQQPQQEGRVDARRVIQRGCIQDADHATPGEVALHQVFDADRRFAEEHLAAGLLEHQQATQDGADAGA